MPIYLSNMALEYEALKAKDPVLFQKMKVIIVNISYII